MVARYSLQIKHGYYHAVISYKDGTGKYRQKSLTTRIPAVKGNKRKAEQTAADIVDAWMTEHEADEREAREIGLSDALDSFLKEKRNAVQPSTLAEYTRLGKNLVSLIGDKTVSKIDTDTILNLRRALQERGDSDSTFRHYTVLANSVLQWAEQNGHELSKPGFRADTPKVTKFRGASWYSTQEVRKLLTAADVSDIRCAVYLAAYLGLRRSEALGLRWDNINLQDRIVRVCEKRVEYSDKGKTIVEQSARMKTVYSDRVLPIPEALYDVLVAEPDKRDHVVKDAKGKPLAPQYLTKKFSLLLEKNRLRKIRFHDLRHTCASLLLQSGVDMKTVQIILGHGSYSTTADIYSHVDLKGKQAAIEKYEAIL